MRVGSFVFIYLMLVTFSISKCSNLNTNEELESLFEERKLIMLEKLTIIENSVDEFSNSQLTKLEPLFEDMNEKMEEIERLEEGGTEAYMAYAELLDEMEHLVVNKEISNFLINYENEATKYYLILNYFYTYVEEIIYQVEYIMYSSDEDLSNENQEDNELDLMDSEYNEEDEYDYEEEEYVIFQLNNSDSAYDLEIGIQISNIQVLKEYNVFEVPEELIDYYNSQNDYFLSVPLENEYSESSKVVKENQNLNEITFTQYYNENDNDDENYSTTNEANNENNNNEYDEEYKDYDDYDDDDVYPTAEDSYSDYSISTANTLKNSLSNGEIKVNDKVDLSSLRKNGRKSRFLNLVSEKQRDILVRDILRSTLKNSKISISQKKLF